MPLETPLTQYNLKQITPAVEEFSTAAAEGPLLKKPTVDYNCCVTLFDNYKLANCETIFQDSDFREKSCLTWAAATHDPEPSNRAKVYQLDGSAAENDRCNCALVPPNAIVGLYTFNCPASIFPSEFIYHPSVYPSIGVYPGCSVRITAYGKVRPVSQLSFAYHGYVTVLEQFPDDCCGSFECESPSVLTVELPTPWVESLPYQSSCSTTFSGKAYRYLSIGFDATKTPGAATYCCPGHTYEPDFGACKVALEEDCPENASLYNTEGPPGSAFCGYQAAYTCDQTLLDLTPLGLSATYTNNSNCIGILSMDFVYSLTIREEGPSVPDANLCFEDSTLYYTIEVLSGGC